MIGGRRSIRLTVDDTWRRFGSTVLAGSPLRLFRLTPAGVAVAESIERGDEVGASGLVERLLDGGAAHPASSGAGSFTIDDVTVVTPQLGGECHHDGRITVDDGTSPPLDGADVRLETNRGPAAARNAARSSVTTELVAFLDADVSVSAGDRRRVWLAPLVAHFDDPRVGLVAPRVQGEVGSPLDLGVAPARVRAGSRVSYVPGAAIVVRVAALDSIGWFDERLRFGEDVDLVWRLDQAGWRCRYEPTASVWHQPRPTWRGRLAQHYGYGTSAAPLALRHPHALAPARMNGWTASAWVVLALGHPVAAITLAGLSAGALIGKLPGVPALESFALAMRGHLAAGRQISTAIRRSWWPIVAVGSLVSRRVRLIGLISLLVGGRSTPTDLAYATGVWAGMLRARTAAPIAPAISSWPARQPARGRPATQPATPPEPDLG